MLSVLFIFAITAISTGVCYAVPAFKLAAFNVQVLGKTKVSKTHVVDVLVKIVNRYDIILIQEIRERQGKDKAAIDIVLENVNQFARANGFGEYTMIISERLGRTASKEQYAFLYRKNVAKVVANYTYLDENDDFEREPFVVHFTLRSASIKDIVLIGIHTKPTDAVNEVDKLVDVYDDVIKRWNIANVVIMGDLNAACNYVRDADWPNIRLAKDKRFWWLTSECEDTTLKGSRCAYDRLITGNNLLENIVGGSPGVFDFRSFYHLNSGEARDVSDHFPVEFEIKGKDWIEHESLDFVFSRELRHVSRNDIYNTLRRKHRHFFTSTLYKKSGGIAEIKLSTTTFYNITSAMIIVRQIEEQGLHTIMGDIHIELVEKYLMRLKNGATIFPYRVFSQFKNGDDVKVKIQLIWDVGSTVKTFRMVISKYI